MGTTLSGLSNIQVRVTGARGEVGINVVGAPAEGQFLVKLDSGPRDFAGASSLPDGSVIDALTPSSGVAPSGRAILQELASRTGPALFADTSLFSISAAQVGFLSAGFSADGIGAGMYMADSLATAALAASCPQFCKADASGRYFRLATSGGMIAISQGGARGSPHNDQPAVQACIDYCKAIGCTALLLDFGMVDIWNTVRTSNAAQTATDAWAQDGQSIWITAPITFIGLPTHIRMLAHDGTSLETGWQNVGGNVWRGSGINLLGGASEADHTSYNNTFFCMEDIWLDGGCDYTGVRTAVTPSSPDGPDLTNKGIRQQDTEVDTIEINRCRIDGFKGETAYTGGGTLKMRQTTLAGSNQSCLNPSTGTIDIDDCDITDTNSAFEILGGAGGRINNVRFKNCVQVSVTGGPANGLQYNFQYPTRDPTIAPPWLIFSDCDFINVQQLLVGNYIQMKDCRATDMAIVMASAVVNGVLTSTYIDFDYTIDQLGPVIICNLQGPSNLTTVVPGAPAGVFIAPPSDVHVKLNVHRTANAIANGRYAYPFAVTGLFDTGSCSLKVGDADGIIAVSLRDYGGTTLSLPLLTCDQPSNSQTMPGGVPLALSVLTMTAGPYAIVPFSPRHGLQNQGAAAAIACTIATTIKYASGQRTRLYWYGSPAGTTFTFSRNGAGMRLNTDCTLTTAFDWIEVEYNVITGLWHEIGRSIHTP